MSSIAAAERLEQQIADAVADGATVLLGGGRDGAFVEPTVLVDVTPENRAHAEEFFGPVAVVHRASDEAQAVEIANDTPYGLGSYVFSRDPGRARRERFEWHVRRFHSDHVAACEGLMIPRTAT